MKVITIENKLIRVLFAVLLSCPLALLFTNLAIELFVYCYMYINEITLRSELSEDYGLGLAGMAFFIVTLIISIIGFFIVIYKITGDDEG